MGWYRTTKKINGHLYDYWQRTYRVGKSVKTENKYIGPSGASGSAHTSIRLGIQKHRSADDSAVQPTYANQLSTTTSLPTTVSQPDPYPASTADNPFEATTLSKAERRDDERIQYGPRAARIRKMEAAIRKAKRETRRIKKLNPFLGKALKK